MTVPALTGKEADVVTWLSVQVGSKPVHVGISGGKIYHNKLYGVKTDGSINP